MDTDVILALLGAALMVFLVYRSSEQEARIDRLSDSINKFCILSNKGFDDVANDNASIRRRIKKLEDLPTKDIKVA